MELATALTYRCVVWHDDYSLALGKFDVSRTEDCRRTCPLALAGDGLFVELSLSTGWLIRSIESANLQGYILAALESYAAHHKLKFIAILDPDSASVAPNILFHTNRRRVRCWQSADWNALRCKGYEKIVGDFTLKHGYSAFQTVYIRYFPNN
jgi:hypothetical protein